VTVYLDNNASTPVAPRVRKRFDEAIKRYFANPSSTHKAGQEAKAALIQARGQIAECLEVSPQEIVFTASATECANILLRGYCGPLFRGHVITSSIEHAAVFETCQALKAFGVDVTFLPPDERGAIMCVEIEKAIRPDTKLLCFMASNNETGVITDIEALGDLAFRRNIPLIVDGVGYFGKEPLKVYKGISAIFFSGHKFHAPRGAAFMCIKKNLHLTPTITGGHQEGGKRAGTENVPAICALAEAVQMAVDDLELVSGHMGNLRDLFESKLREEIPGMEINGRAALRVCNTSNIYFPKVDGEAFLISLDLHGVQASLGSACAAGGLEPSRVLLQMDLGRKKASSSLRFSLSRFTTKEEIEKAISVVSSCYTCSS
jgi:cysteine desulfurase